MTKLFKFTLLTLIILTSNIIAKENFFDEAKNQLIDLSENDLNSIEIKKQIPGKKIKSIEVLVRLVEQK